MPINLLIQAAVTIFLLVLAFYFGIRYGRNHPTVAAKVVNDVTNVAAAVKKDLS